MTKCLRHLVMIGIVGAATLFSSHGNMAKADSKKIPDEFFYVSSHYTTMGTPYYFRGIEYAKMKDLLGSARKIYADELSRISVNKGPKAGKLRIALSAPQSYDPLVLMTKNWDPDPKVNAAIISDLTDYTKLSDASYIEALRKSNRFDSITVEQDEEDPPSARGADFVAWRYGQRWMIRKGDGPRSILRFSSDTGFPGMIKALPETLQNATNLAIRNPSTLSMYQVGARNFYAFNGMEYEGYDKVVAAIEAAWKSQVEAAPTAKTAIGGVTRIIVSTQQRLYQSQSKNAALEGPRRDEFARVAIMFHRTIALAQAEALKKSGLFDDTVIETMDIDDISLEGYDVVIWQSASKPTTWYFRTHGMPAPEILKGFPPNDLAGTAIMAGMQIHHAGRNRKKINAFLWPSRQPAPPDA